MNLSLPGDLLSVVAVGGFEAFAAENYDSVRRALAVAFGDAERAADVAQEAFARAWRRWPRVSTMERPVAWVYVVALNQAKRDLRLERHLPGPPPVSPPSDVAGSVATRISLQTALDGLAPRQRAVVVLRYLADLSTAEVARALGCAEGTVKSTLHAALTRLRIEVGEEE